MPTMELLLYPDACPVIYDTLLSDLNIQPMTQPLHAHAITYDNVMPHDIVTLLTIYDKLIISTTINSILKLNITLPEPMSTQIINHTLGNDDIISVYANKYNVLYNGTITATKNLTDATANGLHVQRIIAIECTQNEYIQSCTSIMELDITQ